MASATQEPVVRACLRDLAAGPIERPHVLVADDDPDIRHVLTGYLADSNMRVTAVPDRRGVLRTLETDSPDIVLLDVRLGPEDGLEILRELRRDSVVPVILMTGHPIEELDRVIGLEIGADDYVTKPFAMRELLARIRSALRRRRMDSLHPERINERTYVFDRWTLVQRTRTLLDENEVEVPLTKAEFSLLSMLVLAPGRPLSREHLMQATRVHEDVYDRSIDVQILRLRRKLERDPRSPTLIRTERGVGYALSVEVRQL